MKKEKNASCVKRVWQSKEEAYLARIFEFRDCGEVEVDSIKYSYTSHGDEFYLVFIDGENKPALAYACKIYDYKE